MKKWIACLMALILCLTHVTALAGGVVTVEQVQFTEINDLWHSVYGFARVKNTGDAAIYLEDGLMQVWDAENGIVASTSYMDAHAACLQPGEYTYVEMSCDIDDGAAAPDHAEITVGAESDFYYTNLRLPVATDLKLNVTEGWWDYNYMYAAVQNNTDMILYDIEVVLALLDSEGNILYIDSHDLYDDTGLAPGSKIMIRKDISSSFMDYFETNGIVPASVDAIAFVELETE